MFDYIADNSLCMKKEDLALKPYCYDARIKKYVFMITTKKIGKEDCYKKYGCPQCPVHCDASSICRILFSRVIKNGTVYKAVLFVFKAF